MTELRELGWDDVITNEEGGEFILLPPGDYEFTVSSFTRERHNGSTKLPPCNKAVLNILIETKEGRAVIKHQLFLHQKTEGLLCSFFRAIGQKKHGEALKMDWYKVECSKGRCQVGVREYTTDSGEVRQANEIKKFYDYEAPAPKAFTPGNF